VLFQKSLIN